MHRPSDLVRSTHSQDGGTILDLRDGRLFRLNSTASLIWEQLRNGQPAAQIAKTVADCFGISEEVARNDVAHFLESARQYELLLRYDE
jgi:hypothetical protein